jgi:hypothetical protein
MKHVEWWRYSSTQSLSQQETEASSQLHAAVISCPGKKTCGDGGLVGPRANAGFGKRLKKNPV